jgi:hypothetical protein
VGPEVLAGPVIWAMEDAQQILGAYRRFVASAPPEVSSAVVLGRLPVAPFLPAWWACSRWASRIAERLLATMRTFGRPLLDLVKRLLSIPAAAADGDEMRNQAPAPAGARPPVLGSRFARVSRSWRTAVMVVRPDTVVRWHRDRLRRRWSRRLDPQAERPSTRQSGDPGAGP